MSARPRAHSQDPRVSPTARVRPDLAPPPPLPVPLGPLVGRTAEVDGISATLRQPEVRLVTLTGPGGVGKSRLALAAGAALQPDFADGVRLVRLAAITDPTLVLPAIAATLGLREVGGQSDLETLQHALHDRELLLLLDNFEQILPAATDVADLLRACPHVKALVTSRARLRVRGEHVMPVMPLGVPEQSAVADLDALLTYPAVELFVQRGREIRPDLAQAAAFAGAVADICRRLDGLPLAIELAAARLDILPPMALLERLRQPLPLLVGGARDLPDRLRTMRDAIIWSYALLSEEEQRIFRRLAVFSGGWTSPAAGAVAGLPDELTVLEALASLTDKSLIQPMLHQAQAGLGEPRYGMLQTIREFALDELVARGEEQEVRERHAAFFLALAEDAELHLHGVAGDQAGWFARIDAEFSNLRAAIVWLLAAGEGTNTLRVLVGLEGYMSSRFNESEVRLWVKAALAMAPDAPPLLRAGAYYSLVSRAAHTATSRQRSPPRRIN